METNDFGVTSSIIQLEVLRERQKHLEESIRQKEQELIQAYNNFNRKEKEAEQVRDERDALKINLEVLKKDLKIEQSLSVQTAKKRNATKFQAFLASLIFLLSSVLVNIGTSMLTSNPPNSPLGWFMMALAAAAYIIAALMTTLLALEGRN